MSLRQPPSTSRQEQNEETEESLKISVTDATAPHDGDAVFDEINVMSFKRSLSRLKSNYVSKSHKVKNS